MIKKILLLIIIGFITYVSSFTNQFVWDDHHFIHQNVFLQKISRDNTLRIFSSNTTAGAGVSSDYFRPLTSLSFALDKTVWRGWNVAGLHLTNTALHIACGILIFVILSYLGLGTIASFWIAVIFLVHPVQTEAVTYLSSRGDPFYSLLILISLCFFLLSFKKRRLLFLAVSVATYFTAIFAKETALAAFPMHAAMLLLIKLKEKLSWQEIHAKYRAQIVSLLIMFLLAIGYVFLRLTILNFQDSLDFTSFNDVYTGSLLIRACTFAKIVWLYAKLIIFPYPLFLERTTSYVTNPLSVWVLASLLLVVALAYLAIWEIKKKKSGWVSLGLIWILAGILPVSGIIPMTGLYHENWLYMPIVGVEIITVFLWRQFFPKFKAIFKTLAALSLTVVFCIMTIRQNYNWKDSITYFEHNLKFANSTRLHVNLGNSYFGVGNYSKAKYHIKQALAIDSFSPQAHYNLGAIYFKEKKYNLAEKEYLLSLEYDPAFLFAYGELLDLYATTGEYQKSVPILKRLEAIYPNDFKLTLMSAEALFKSGQKLEAREKFQKALMLAGGKEKLVKEAEKGLENCF